MIRDSIRRSYCIKCGGNHMSDYCPRDNVSSAPLETPSHNGEWQGKIPVRVIPPGISSELRATYKTNSDKARAKVQRSLPESIACTVCGSTVPRSQKVYDRHQCSKECHRIYKRQRKKNARATSATAYTRPAPSA